MGSMIGFGIPHGRVLSHSQPKPTGGSSGNRAADLSAGDAIVVQPPPQVVNLDLDGVLVLGDGATVRVQVGTSQHRPPVPDGHHPVHIDLGSGTTVSSPLPALEITHADVTLPGGTVVRPQSQQAVELSAGELTAVVGGGVDLLFPATPGSGTPVVLGLADDVALAFPPGASSVSIDDGGLSVPPGTRITTVPPKRLPAVTSMEPTSGKPGTVVRVRGRYLRGATAVWFGDVTAKFREDGEVLLVTVPERPNEHDKAPNVRPFRIDTPRGSAETAPFRVHRRLRLQEILSGPVAVPGDVVAIRGTGLDDIRDVRVFQCTSEPAPQAPDLPRLATTWRVEARTLPVPVLGAPAPFAEETLFVAVPHGTTPAIRFFVETPYGTAQSKSVRVAGPRIAAVTDASIRKNGKILVERLRVAGERLRGKFARAYVAGVALPVVEGTQTELLLDVPPGMPTGHLLLVVGTEAVVWPVPVGAMASQFPPVKMVAKAKPAGAMPKTARAGARRKAGKGSPKPGPSRTRRRR